jgi:hypothetical protein
MTPREKELLQAVEQLRRENALLRQKIVCWSVSVTSSAS